jgi:hypothetical protein
VPVVYLPSITGFRTDNRRDIDEARILQVSTKWNRGSPAAIVHFDFGSEGRRLEPWRVHQILNYLMAARTSGCFCEASVTTFPVADSTAASKRDQLHVYFAATAHTSAQSQTDIGAAYRARFYWSRGGSKSLSVTVTPSFKLVRRLSTPRCWSSRYDALMTVGSCTASKRLYSDISYCSGSGPSIVS